MDQAAGLARRALGNVWVKLTATVVLLGLVVWRSQPQQIAHGAARLGVGSLLVAALLTLPFLLLKAIRWLLMLRYAGSDATFREATVSLIGGMGVALITPARLGELARIGYLRDPRKLRLSGLVLLDKFFDVLALVLMSVAGAWLIVGWEVGVLLAACGLAGLLFAFLPQTVDPIIQHLVRRVPMGGRTAEFVSSLESLNPTAALMYLALTLAAFAVVILQFWIILHGARPIGFSVAMQTFPLVILTNIVPITIAGLGLREGASVLLLGHFHVAAGLAAISAFAMFFLNTALPGFAGALLPMVRGLNGRQPFGRPEAATPSPHD
jgi:uncharacterized membrane protein YbhN (UPF0104 family)